MVILFSFICLDFLAVLTFFFITMVIKGDFIHKIYNKTHYNKNLSHQRVTTIIFSFEITENSLIIYVILLIVDFLLRK